MSRSSSKRSKSNVCVKKPQKCAVCAQKSTDYYPFVPTKSRRNGISLCARCFEDWVRNPPSLAFHKTPKHILTELGSWAVIKEPPRVKVYFDDDVSDLD